MISPARAHLLIQRVLTERNVKDGEDDLWTGSATELPDGGVHLLISRATILPRRVRQAGAQMSAAELEEATVAATVAGLVEELRAEH